MINIEEKYKKEAVPELKKKFGLKSVMAVPKITKVVLNTGFGRAISGKGGEEQRRYFEPIAEDLGLISGQKPVITRAKKSIASFKLREGMPVGACVTLRGKKMVDFVNRLVNISLPRTRDFRGIDKKSIDQAGNLTISIKEDIVFPEILSEKVRTIFGLEITIVTNAKDREKGLELFKLLGFPLSK